ncbi:TrmH family RNA methyltransferase [Candidatus Peregrinibacteria bacterium]|nr:TrmH family RNA methyltransferase [Candidatus Peregrinibacteria bacterium]
MLRICLFAHNVRSLWNVGSFFRTCDAFAIERIYLSGYTGCPPRKEITKTAIGAEEFVPWEKVTDPVVTLEALKKNGWQIAGLELTSDAIRLQEFHPKSNICVVVGHELTGVPPELLRLCDVTIQIPMLGTKESLNVAVAVGIALYQLRCER